MKDKTLAKLFERFHTTKGIPALEETSISLLTFLSEEGNTDIIRDLITSDFTITQKVLKLANSAMYQPFAGQINSVAEAIPILGPDAITNILLSISIIPEVDVNEDSDLSAALTASHIAKIAAPIEKLEKASIATLMTNIGTLFSKRYLSEELEEIKVKQTLGYGFDEACLVVMGMTIPQLGMEIVSQWQLPMFISEAIEGTGDPEIAQIVKFSNTVSVLIQKEQFEEAAILMEEVDIDVQRYNQLGNFIQDRSKIQHRETNFQFTPKDPNTLPSTTRQLEQQLTDLMTILKTIPVVNTTAFANTAFSRLMEIIKTRHCLFFYRQSGDVFTLAFGKGFGVDAIQQQFKIPIDRTATIFNAVIHRKVSVFIESVDQTNHTSLPPRYHDFFSDTDQFMLLPIYKESVNGLLYFDWAKETGFTSIEFEMIKAAIKEIQQLFSKFFK